MKLSRSPRRSLHARFALGMGAVLLPFLLAAAVGQFYLLPRLIEPLDDIVRELTEELEPVQHLQETLLMAAMPVHDYLIHGDPDERRQFAQRRQRVERAFKGASPEQFTLAEERALIGSARAEWVQALPLGELLGRQARAIDRVCRYGGEEITVILPEVDLAAAAYVAERLRVAVERQPFDIGAGRQIHITASIGAVAYPQQADTLESLVKAADTAMYAAKQGGRNRVCRYEPSMKGGNSSS